MSSFVLAPTRYSLRQRRRCKPTCSYRLALTRAVTPTLAQGLLAPGVSASTVSATQAAVEHAAYVELLRAYVGRVEVLPALVGSPDAVFVEDTAIVHGGRALQGRMGHAARRDESAAMAAALRGGGLDVVRSDATFDGGDILRAEGTFFVGLSERTEAACVDALASTFGLNVVPVDVAGGTLHLKCVVTWVEKANAFVYEDSFAGRSARVQMAGSLPSAGWIAAPVGAANVLDLGETVVVQGRYWDELVTLRKVLANSAVQTVRCNFDEIAKANGSLTCCSILIE